MDGTRFEMEPQGRAGKPRFLFFFFGLRSFFPAGGFSKDEKVHANAMVPRGGE
jgi:hypothetical protein